MGSREVCGTKAAFHVRSYRHIVGLAAVLPRRLTSEHSLLRWDNMSLALFLSTSVDHKDRCSACCCLLSTVAHWVMSSHTPASSTTGMPMTCSYICQCMPTTLLRVSLFLLPEPWQVRGPDHRHIKPAERHGDSTSVSVFGTNLPATDSTKVLGVLDHHLSFNHHVTLVATGKCI